MRVLYLFHHENAVEIAHTLYVAQFLAHELLIRIHVARLYFQNEVKLAARVIAFRYLINSLHGIHEIIHEKLRVLFQSHIA